MKIKFIYFFLTSLTLGCFSFTHSQKIIEPKKINDNQINLDGIINKEEWKNASKVSLDYEFKPGYNTPPDKKTDVYVFYSDKNLYVGFYAYDDSLNVRASIRQRDDMNMFINDDWVNVKLDTYGDSRNNYNLVSNPFGSQADARQTDAIDEFESYDINYNIEFETVGKIVNDGYNVEFKIPFKNLPFTNKKNQEWKFRFFRRTYRDGNEVEFISSKYDRNNSCDVCQTTDIIIFKDIEIEKRFELLPYVSANLIGEKSEKNSKIIYNNLKTDFGLGLNVDLNKNTLFEITYNPDFSQVEADVTKIDINSSYALEYPEKRPYFNRGSDIVKFTDGAFYSRSINNPLISTKLVSQGVNSRIYFLTAVDQNSPYQIGGEDKSYFGEGGESYVNVFRYQHILNKDKRIGFLTTNRYHKDGGYGNLIGTDGWFLLSKKLRISYEFFTNINKEPVSNWIETNDFIKGKSVKLDGDKLRGNAFYFEVYRNTENWKSFFSFSNISPNYQSDVGFMVKNNRRWTTFFQSYQNYLNKKALQFFSIGSKLDVLYTFENNLKTISLDGIITLRTLFGSLIEYTYDWDIYKLYLGKEYKNLPANRIEITSSPNEFFSFIMNMSFGKDIAYNEDVPEIGKEFTLFFSPSFQVNNNLNIQPSIRFARLKKLNENSNFYKGYISRFSFKYQFNNSLNIRLISEYNDFYEQFFIQPLIQWNPNPSTIFYIGGNQGSIEDFNSEFSSPYRIDRTQYFLKFQYLIGL